MNYPTYGINQYYNPTQTIDRQIEELQSLKARYNQPPVTNIINTQPNTNELEAKFINNNENVEDIIVSRRTLFIDENNQQICIKEINGDISKKYQIIVPKDEKDIKIENLENKIKELEVMINDQQFIKQSDNTTISEDKKSEGSNTKSVKK